MVGFRDTEVMYAALRNFAQAVADDPAVSPATKRAALDLVTAVTPTVEDHDGIGEASAYIW